MNEVQILTSNEIVRHNFDKYTILIMLDSPHGNESTYGFATANWNATKVAGKVIKRVGAVLGIPPETVN